MIKLLVFSGSLLLVPLIAVAVFLYAALLLSLLSWIFSTIFRRNKS